MPTPTSPDQARLAFLRGERIGSPARPAMVGGLPFIARDPICPECGVTLTPDDLAAGHDCEAPEFDTYVEFGGEA